CQQAYTSPFTF
nr:immunoglobulin light chain junction region [Macaca mulatta]MOV77312.1 immunoglobulin light chain junction region [Macaca mulatta]MOW09953.1 immunoglobulin light chain junction region [Macaca mulatta]